MTPAERAQRIQAMRDELLRTPHQALVSESVIAYWCGWIIDGYSDAIPPSVEALGEWIYAMEEMVGDHLNFQGPPEGWDGDDEGGAA